MAEYIEREAVQKILMKYTEGMTENIPIYPEKVRLASMDLDAIPAADVVEVKRGKWVEADDGDGVVCSVCGEDFCTIIHETDRFKFCPNCGARMDGE